mgnify:CR=1 FL=1
MDNNVHILELTTYEKPDVIETGQKEYVEFGEDNLYYDWVIGRYKNSTTNNACINNIAKLIYGRVCTPLMGYVDLEEAYRLKMLQENQTSML